MQSGPVVPQESIFAFSSGSVNPGGKEARRVAPSDFVLFEVCGFFPRESAGAADLQKTQICATHYPRQRRKSWASNSSARSDSWCVMVKEGAKVKTFL